MLLVKRQPALLRDLIDPCRGLFHNEMARFFVL